MTLQHRCFLLIKEDWEKKKHITLDYSYCSFIYINRDMKNNEENERFGAEHAEVMIITWKVIGWWNLIKFPIT